MDQVRKLKSVHKRPELNYSFIYFENFIDFIFNIFVSENVAMKRCEYKTDNFKRSELKLIGLCFECILELLILYHTSRLLSFWPLRLASNSQFLVAPFKILVPFDLPETSLKLALWVPTEFQHKQIAVIIRFSRMFAESCKMRCPK